MNVTCRISLTVVLYVIAELTSMVLVLTCLKTYKNETIVILENEAKKSRQIHLSNISSFSYSSDKKLKKTENAA